MRARMGCDRLVIQVVVGLGAMVFFVEAAQSASSPFGVGVPEQAAGTGLLPWIATLQKDFYRELTAALKSLRESGQALWWLAGLSFGYGVVHAAGPGHGKVVISSYLLANEGSARRGILIAFLAAMAQAAMAVALVGVAAVILNMTSIAMTDTARIFEVGSYALIAALGFYLFLRKTRTLFAAKNGHAHPHRHHGGRCGHNHAPLPEQAASARGWSGALAAVMAVGVRPCSGALIVLVFALAQGIFWAGIVSTVLMGFGTAITIALLAVIAVYAKDFAIRLAGAGSDRAALVMNGLELTGAFLIMAFGLLLLGGALVG